MLLLLSCCCAGCLCWGCGCVAKRRGSEVLFQLLAREGEKESGLKFLLLLLLGVGVAQESQSEGVPEQEGAQVGRGSGKARQEWLVFLAAQNKEAGSRGWLRVSWARFGSSLRSRV